MFTIISSADLIFVLYGQVFKAGLQRLRGHSVDERREMITMSELGVSISRPLDNKGLWSYKHDQLVSVVDEAITVSCCSSDSEKEQQYGCCTSVLVECCLPNQS